MNQNINELYHSTTVSFYQIKQWERQNMPQYYILEQGKNTSQHIGSTERSKNCFFFRFLNLTFKEANF